MPPPQFHCLAPDPRRETLPARAGAESGMKQPPPKASPLISSQRASSTGKRSLWGRGARQPLTVALATAGCPPGEAARHFPAERSILSEGIPAPLAQLPSLPPAGLLEGSSHRGTAGDPRRAREKCRAGTEQLFQPGVSSGRLAGTGGCFPSTHVRSKQRKKEKNNLRV